MHPSQKKIKIGNFAFEEGPEKLEFPEKKKRDTDCSFFMSLAIFLFNRFIPI